MPFYLARRSGGHSGDRYPGAPVLLGRVSESLSVLLGFDGGAGSAAGRRATPSK